MKILINDYVISCLTCQLSKSSWQFSYDKLKLMFFSKKSLAELNFDFIIEFFMISNENNVILIITNRFSKYVKIVSKKKHFQSKNEIRFIKNMFLKIEEFLRD